MEIKEPLNKSDYCAVSDMLTFFLCDKPII